jgi:antirestriction protein ArdC
VAYIQGWLKALANDNKMIVWAASRAEKAARYILGEEPLEGSHYNEE